MPWDRRDLAQGGAAGLRANQSYDYGRWGDRLDTDTSANCGEALAERRVCSPLLQASGIEQDRLRDVNHVVPLISYVRFFEAAAAAVSDPHFGLDCGRSIDSGSLGAISFLFMSAPSLSDAFRGLTPYLAAAQTTTINGLEVTGQEAVFHNQIADDRIAKPPAGCRMLYERNIPLDLEICWPQFSPAGGAVRA